MLCFLNSIFDFLAFIQWKKWTKDHWRRIESKRWEETFQIQRCCTPWTPWQAWKWAALFAL